MFCLHLFMIWKRISGDTVLAAAAAAVHSKEYSITEMLARER
jgi:hypothetical protein